MKKITGLEGKNYILGNSHCYAWENAIKYRPYITLQDGVSVERVIRAENETLEFDSRVLSQEEVLNGPQEIVLQAKNRNPLHLQKEDLLTFVFENGVKVKRKIFTINKNENRAIVTIAQPLRENGGAGKIALNVSGKSFITKEKIVLSCVLNKDYIDAQYLLVKNTTANLGFPVLENNTSLEHSIINSILVKIVDFYGRIEQFDNLLNKSFLEKDDLKDFCKKEDLQSLEKQIKPKDPISFKEFKITEKKPFHCIIEYCPVDLFIEDFYIKAENARIALLKENKIPQNPQTISGSRLQKAGFLLKKGEALYIYSDLILGDKINGYITYKSV